MSSGVQFDLSGFSRRQTMIVIGSALVIVAAAIGLILVLGGGRGEEQVVGVTTAPVMPTLMPSFTPSPSPTSLPTSTLPPTLTPTLEPYQYTVQAGDTLYYIIRLFGYRDMAVIPEVLALNGLTDEDDIQANQILLIPRQTPTPGPTSPEVATPVIQATLTQPAPGMTPAASGGTPDYRGCGIENRCISPDGQFWMHEVVEGDTCAGLAYAYDTTVPDILQDNGLGEDCIILPGQIMRVRIKVTLTPSLTPTGGPDSTATPTPTLSPPSLLAPANGATIARNQTVALQWAANHPLPAGAYYLVQLRNTTTGETLRTTTRSNVYRLPTSLQPGIGQSVQYEWHVMIVNGNTADSPVISGQGGEWVFTWGP